MHPVASELEAAGSVGVGARAAARGLIVRLCANPVQRPDLVASGWNSPIATLSITSPSNQRWCSTMDLPGPALPAQEDVLFRHLAEVYDECGAATRGQSLIEALNLTCATIGLASDAQESSRVKGAAAASFAQKRGTLQRPPLTVQAIRVLADGVTNASCLCDRVFCGFLAFCAHTRTRFLNGARICVEPVIDEADAASFIEAASNEHKGANRPRVRGLSLPVVGHAIGVRGEPWAEAWLEVRRAIGLNAAT